MSDADDRRDPTPERAPAGEPRPEVTAPPPDAEAPPRGVRVMGVVRWALLALVALVALVSVIQYCPSGDGEPTSARADLWCPMHPEVRSDQPGQCPICHMDLVPIPPAMREPGGGADAAASGDRYWCPMHHEVRSDQPGQCPICHMDLVPIPPAMREPGGGDGGGRDPALPELAPVTVSRERLQLGGVEMGEAATRTVAAALRLPATVEAPQTTLAHVHLRTPGFLERVAVRQTGVHVKRGQPLAWVYSAPLYQAQLELLAARRWTAPGAADGGAAAGRLEQVASAGRTALELQGMAAQDIDEVLRRGEPMRAVPLRSPASGYVVRTQAIVGMYATEEMILYEISDLSRVWVVGSVYPRDLSSVHAGMTARFEPAAGGEPIEGVVELVEPEVGAATRTTQVRLAVANPDLRLRPGQYGDLVFDLRGREALVVPRDAVVDTGERQYVFLDRGGGRLEPRRVRVGALFGEQREVLEGLAPGDRVVARGTFLIDSESRLAASIEQTPAAPAGGGGGDLGPDCETAFDREGHPEAYQACRECERAHAGMGSMVADCKNAIPGPWR